MSREMLTTADLSEVSKLSECGAVTKRDEDDAVVNQGRNGVDNGRFCGFGIITH